MLKPDPVIEADPDVIICPVCGWEDRSGRGQLAATVTCPNGHLILLTPAFGEVRPDGWPLCPVCGADEVYSRMHWNGQGERPPLQSYIDAGLACYACQWSSDHAA